ncbi:hypothetical protein Q8W71_21500 [Methylobacterium sp. NEAU 140]|uniref:hypothetical protein n=1 Tax=Methylobacterium sp. NEAU 140 TaxID=3064945 RepID=UPI00273320AB|nr:hypothetical protein [Methylobacterium sp. NEAU 140]MDP4025211.1 hypothetical protein [Methylobacterium sp. NEAU 140]
MSDPTPAQTLLLWCLLARHGGAPQGEIVPAVRKPDREALVSAGLVAVEKRGRALILSVTDKGWHWAGAHLDAPVPPSFRVLGDLLTRLGRHLGATGGTLADFIGAPPEPAGAAPAPEAPRRAPAKAPAPRPRTVRKPGPRQLRARIEDAYLALTGGERARAVRLSALRTELADLDRATVDDGLARILKGDGTARLSQLSDPKALTQAERRAAFSPAGEPFHLIWIQA